MNSVAAKPSFWGSTHPLSEDAKRLTAQYVPTMGGTQHLEAECLRAANRLLYELYNNGGGNPKGNEVNFLLRYGSICGLSKESVLFLKTNLVKLGSSVMWPSSWGGFLESVLAEVVSHILKIEKEGRALMPGSFDLLDKEYHFEPHDICTGCGVDCTENGIDMNYDMCRPCFNRHEEEQEID